MTRPLFACKGRIFSLQNINSLFLDQGRLQSAGFDGIESPVGLMKKQVEAVCSRLSCLRKELATLIVATQLPTLFEVNERRERVKRKKHLASDLRPGDLVFDSVHYSSSSNLTGSLGKIVKLGTSTRHCLIEKCLPSHGRKGKTFATFAKNVVSRPTGELHFICSKDELQTGVTFGKALPPLISVLIYKVKMALIISVLTVKGILKARVIMLFNTWLKVKVMMAM